MVQKTKFGPTSDFSPIASSYDLTRDIPQLCLKACYERLVRQRLLPAQGVILDAGCGTGQISLALAEMGYAVCGFDVSPEMLLIARAKRRPEWRAHYVAADVRSLPVHGIRFDAVVVSKRMASAVK
jgi:ubiquinone/menaquinone biosynthesis C-methylase UbiE